jgi:hypothetical protein
MKNEFQLFDKKNVLFDYLFEAIKKTISNNNKIKNRTLKILSCYYGPEKYHDLGRDTILNEVRDACKELGIKLELILSRNIYNQYADKLKGSKYFKVYPYVHDGLFHGKAVAYVHGSYKIKLDDVNEIQDVKMTTGDGILLVTSANFSSAYFGKNVETGVLIKNKKTLESFLLEFEKSKGNKQKSTGVKSYNSFYDVLSNGFMLFNDKNATLYNISTFHLPIKKDFESNDHIARIGGVISEGNLSISLGKTGKFNIDEFERDFPKPKNAFSKYSINTPFGLWINIDIYNEIIKNYEPLFKLYKNQIKECFTEENLDEISNIIFENISGSEEIMKILDIEISNIYEKIMDWKEQLLQNVTDDSTMSQMFFGYETIEFPLDPNYTSTLAKFTLYTKNMNYKKPKAKNPKENIKNILRPFVESGSNDFQSLEFGFAAMKQKIKKEFIVKNNEKVFLKYNNI